MAYKTQNILARLVSLALAVGFSFSVITFFLPVQTEAARTFIFPIIGNANFTNDYYAPRENGIHQATDVFAKKGSKLVAMTDGVINWVASPEPSWGYSLAYTDDFGYTYSYIHMNNDAPGTDNGKGTEMGAYAPDMQPGNRVRAGQLLGYVGDSGNAETTPPHLHLRIDKPGGESRNNPYNILINAKHISKPRTPYVQSYETLPFGNAKRNIDIVAGNFDLDANSEFAAAVNSNGSSKIKIYDDDETVLASFNTYDSSYQNGVSIGSGDVDGDGVDEVIVGRNDSGRVRVYRVNGTKPGDFFAYSKKFSGATRVAGGDIDGDGEDEIITAIGNDGPPRVRAFELDGTRIQTWDAYSSSHKNGLFVAAGDLDGDLVDEIVISVGKGSQPKVKIFEADGTKIGGFYAYTTKNKGGVRVDVGNVDTSTTTSEIVTVLANGGKSRVNAFTIDGTRVDYTHRFVESWWVGSYDVAAGEGYAWAAAFRNRRATIREGLE